MRPFIIGIAFLLALAFFGTGIYVAIDGGNIDTINPVPTTRPMTEIDLAAHVDDNQVEMAKDATGKITTVAIAGYTTIAGITAQHTFRDVAMICGLCFLGWVWLQSKRKEGGK